MSQEDHHHVSEEIMHTYYAKSFFPTDEEVLRKLGVDPSRVHRIHNGPEMPLPAFLAQVDEVMKQIFSREQAQNDETPS